MIAELKPYAEYRESGLPWLGEVPSHWEGGPGFAAFREKKVKNIGLKEKTVLSLSYGHIIVKSEDKLHGLVPESFETYQIVNPGDIIIRSTDLQNDKTSLRVGLVKNRGIITSAYMCMRATGTFIPEYGYQLLHAFDLMKVFYGMGSGLRQNLDFSDFKRLPIFVPPPEEQTAIVRFLDHINRRLEKTIRAKRKLIALLNEQKQVIIHRAVTRGLDSTVPLKDSGVPWLGEIPAHWEVFTLKRLAKIIDGDRGSEYPNAGDFVTSGIPFLSSKCIKYGKLCLNKAFFISEDKFRRLRQGKLIAGDLVITVRGTIGSCAIFSGVEYRTAFINAQMMIIRPNCSKISSEYFSLLSCSRYWKEQLDLKAYGSAQQQLSNQILANIPLPIPPIEEQEKILLELQLETKIFDSIIARTEREIALLREYRIRLIADVVTGKLDVREAAAQLPEETEEQEESPMLEEEEEVTDDL